MTAPLKIQEARLLQMLIERFKNFESLEHEVKSAQGGLPKDIWPTVSAFANTRGGWILLGFRESTGTIEGVPKAHQRLQEFYDLLRNKNKISYPVCGPNDAAIFPIDEKDTIVIRIPAVSRKDRPVYISGNPYEGTYTRGHTGDHHCTKQEINRMMAEASEGSDNRVLPEYGFADIDGDTLAKYRRRFQNSKPGSEFNSLDDKDFVRKVEGYRRDRQRDEEGLTVAGLLLLGKQEIIHEWRNRHLIDYREISDSSERWDARIEWEGNLYGAFEAVFPQMINNQPAPFRLQGAQRVNPLERALREALVNLIVHADYAESDSSLITRSSDGYYLRNPGSSLVPEYDLYSGDRSNPRNPVLVRMFRYVGLAEEAGSGMLSIRNAWQTLGYQYPLVDVGTERNEFSLSLRYVDLIPDEDRVWLSSLVGTLSKEEQLALITARNEGAVTNAKLQRVLSDHPADITKMLGKLRDRGYLTSMGNSRQTYYELGPHASVNSRNPVASKRTNIDNSPPQIANKTASMTNKEQLASDPVLESLPESLKMLPDVRRLLHIAQPAISTKRLTPLERAEIIYALCLVTPLSIADLATLMHRSEQLIRLAVQELRQSMRLVLYYPDQPRRRDQKYVAIP